MPRVTVRWTARAVNALRKSGWVILLAAVVAEAAPQVITFRDGESPSPAYAGTRDISVVLPAVSDGDPNATYNVNPMDVDGYPAEHICLLRWDVSSLSGVTVNSASIVLNVVSTAVKAYDVYPVLTPWSASTATWNQASTGVPWTTPGAKGAGSDRGAALIGTLDGSSAGLTSIALNAAGVSMVQSWIDTPAANHGVLMGNPWHTSNITFNSNEHGDVTLRPRLVITHSGGTTVMFQQNNLPTNGYVGATDVFIGRSRFVSNNLDGEGLITPAGTGTFLIAFDVSAVPPSTPVLSVELLLKSGSKGHTRDIHEALKPWTEAATWATQDGTTAWASSGSQGSGTDLDPTVLTSTGPVGPEGDHVFALNSAGVALVQGWIDGSKANQGFVAALGSGNMGSSFHDRHSPLASDRPGLRITYDDLGGGITPVVPDAGAGVPIGPGGGISPLQFRVGCACGTLGEGQTLGGWLLLIWMLRRRWNARPAQR